MGVTAPTRGVEGTLVLAREHWAQVPTPTPWGGAPAGREPGHAGPRLGLAPWGGLARALPRSGWDGRGRTEAAVAPSLSAAGQL